MVHAAARPLRSAKVTRAPWLPDRAVRGAACRTLCASQGACAAGVRGVGGVWSGCCVPACTLREPHTDSPPAASLPVCGLARRPACGRRCPLSRHAAARHGAGSEDAGRTRRRPPPGWNFSHIPLTPARAPSVAFPLRGAGASPHAARRRRRRRAPLLPPRPPTATAKALPLPPQLPAGEQPPCRAHRVLCVRIAAANTHTNALRGRTAARRRLSAGRRRSARHRPLRTDVTLLLPRCRRCRRLLPPKRPLARPPGLASVTAPPAQGPPTARTPVKPCLPASSPHPALPRVALPARAIATEPRPATPHTACTPERRAPPLPCLLVLVRPPAPALAPALAPRQ